MIRSDLEQNNPLVNALVFDESKVTEFIFEFSDAYPYQELFLACKNGDIATIEAKFPEWWGHMFYFSINYIATKLRAMGHNALARIHEMQLDLLRRRVEISTPAYAYEQWLQRMNATTPSTFEYIPLHVAAAFGKTEALEKLLELIRTNLKKKTDTTDLVYPIVLCANVDQNPAPNPLPNPLPALNFEPMTALEFACKYNHPDIVERLLQPGADTTLPAKVGLDSKTALMWCIEHQMDIKLISALIGIVKNKVKKAYINTRCQGNDLNALEGAMVHMHSAPLVRELLLNGASCESLATDQMPARNSLSFALDLCKPECSIAERLAYRDIAQMLLVFVADNNKAHLEELHRAALAVHPDLAALNNPGFLLCRVACRLIDRPEAMVFLRRVLENLPKKSRLVEQFLMHELVREEPGWFNTKRKAALNSNNFCYSLLEQLAQDAPFLQRLNMQPADYAQFSNKEAVRVAFLKQLTQNLSHHLKSSTDHKVTMAGDRINDHVVASRETEGSMIEDSRSSPPL